jgi:uncharacterized membrane protein
VAGRGRGGSGQSGIQESDPDPAREVARITQSISWEGPIPPPALLSQFNNVITNGAERIFAMAERQSAHREDIEKRIIYGNVASQTRSSWFAFIIVIIATLCGTWLIHEGKNGAGLAAIFTPMGGVIAVFFYSKREQKNERIQKSKALTTKRKR